MQPSPRSPPFHFPNWNSVLHQTLSLELPLSPNPGNHHSTFPVSMNLTPQGTSYYWSYIIFAILWLAHFNWLCGSLSFFHVGAWFRIVLFLRLNNISCVCSCFVYSFICWWPFGLLPLLAIVADNAAMNLGMYVYSSPCFRCFWYTPRSGIAGSNNNSVFNFLGIAIPFSVAAAPFYIPISNVQAFHFFHIFAPCQCCFLLFFFFCS